MRHAAIMLGFGSLLVLGGCVSLTKPPAVAECSKDKSGCRNNQDGGPGVEDGAAAADLPAPTDGLTPDSRTPIPDAVVVDGGVGDGSVNTPDRPGDTPPPSLDGPGGADLPIPDSATDSPVDAPSDIPPVLAGACAPNGQRLAAGTVCRPARGICDRAEVCDGVNPDCPPDQLENSDTVCRRMAGECDIAESCTGTDPACPMDRFLAAGALCRAAAGICDVAESCTGEGADCPLDAFAPAATPCRASTDLGRCDPAETCPGTAVTCPTDAKYTRPAAPSGVTVTPGTLEATLTWTAVPGATGYNVNRSVSASAGYTTRGTSPTTVEATYVDTGLTGGTSYYYIVTAINTVPTCESPLPAPVVAVPVGACTPPAAPVLVATPANGQIGLSWTAVAGAVSYTLARSTSPGTGYVSLALVDTGTSYTDLAVVDGTTYYYVATASNGACSSDNSAEASAAPTCTPPPAPAGLQATAGNGTVALSWTAAPGAVSYRVLRSTTSGAGHVLVGTTTGTTFTDTDVVNDTPYYYVVTAGNGSCNSVPSTQAAATPACVPPSVPASLTATPGDRVVVLSWSASTGSATSYQVLRGTSALGPFTALGTTPTTGYTDVTVSNGTAYSYVVKASNGACASANSTPATATPVCTPPPTPAGLLATPGDAQVTLAWTATAAGTTTYQVLRGTAGAGPFTLLASPTSPSYTDTTAVNGTTYYYVVRSDNGSCASPNSLSVSAQPGTCTQAAPTGLEATAGNKQVALTWTAAAGATSYDIGRSTASGAGYTSVGSATTTSFVDTDAALVNGTTYYYVVAANGECRSPNTTPVSAIPACVPPAVPSGITATANPSNGQITIAWSPVATATAYTVSRGTAGTGPFTAVSAGQTAASFTDDSALTAGATYYYVVSASNGGGTCASANSTPAVSAQSCTLPVVPAGLVATAQTLQVTLNWTASFGATSYEVRRGTAAAGPFAALATPTSATYVDTAVTADTTYYYVVVARNGDGNCVTASSAVAHATPRACPISSGGTAVQFGTTGAYCLTTCDDIAGWGCSNFDGRTTTVNGAPMSACNAALPAKSNGAYTFRATAGTYSWAALYWWGTAKACP